MIWITFPFFDRVRFSVSRHSSPIRSTCSLSLSHKAGFRIKYKTFDLHAESPYENFVTEHENMFTEEGKKIKFLIAEPIREDQNGI